MIKGGKLETAKELEDFSRIAEESACGSSTNWCSLEFLPSVSTVWFGDYYFSTYSGYAKYRELFSLTHARLLWWFESDEDIYHPTPHRPEFYTEITQAEMDNHLTARQT
ncbi:hypothetical protein OUZ56_010368 [Daphnia magna]|uniref:Uncharacterized protein n=1 Tax=Daphnia magna TaxID=35525 RepID=A0ABR0AIC3_9CRUS|nr:hypothetical protein OUZ56_010368 [Daphnia magna]